jgi:hypothetical protein
VALLATLFGLRKRFGKNDEAPARERLPSMP